jgi:Rps23 Pro-64 3,4-dihydroxylase Tpa1-like proline 4-hydroxylase
MATTSESTGILESLSDSLWRDDRILTENERRLLANVLRHARSGDAAQDELVARTIAAAVGEAIAHRLIEVESASTAQTHDREASVHFSGPGPKRSGPGPKSSAGPGPKSGGPGPKMGGPGPKSGGPGPKMAGPGPKSGGPGPKMGGPGPKSGGPGPKSGGPGPKSGGPGPKASAARTESVAMMAGAPVLVLDEFLAPQEFEQLAQYVRAHESDFVLSEVVAPGASATTVDFEHRRSRVLFDLGRHEDVISGRILSYLPRVLPALGLNPFPIARVEAQITASNHGDYFRPHEDNGEPPLRTRELTFVYFFHREPRPFRGGELRIYHPRGANGNAGSTYRAIVPQQNQIVFFPSHLLHEITPVHCASHAFADSRFTLNGWFHRPE